MSTRACRSLPTQVSISTKSPSSPATNRSHRRSDDSDAMPRRGLDRQLCRPWGNNHREPSVPSRPSSRFHPTVGSAGRQHRPCRRYPRSDTVQTSRPLRRPEENGPRRPDHKPNRAKRWRRQLQRKLERHSLDTFGAAIRNPNRNMN